jgi:hypothetical protein
MKKVGGLVMAIAASFGLGACGIDNGLQPSEPVSQTALLPQADGGVSASGQSSSGSTLTVAVTGSSKAIGYVMVYPLGVRVAAGATKSFAITPGRTITLGAYADRSQFVGWRGACTGTDTTCTLTIASSITSVQASFYR